MRQGAPMVRSATPPNPAHAGGLLARLSPLGFGNGLFRSLNPQPSLRGKARRVDSTPDSRTRAWLMESVSWAGVGLSAVLAGVGVIGLVGFESLLAKIGSGILLGGTVLTEIAAARLPVHAERRFREGSWVKGAAVVAGFAALTCWNVIAGHFGMQAIDAAGVNDARAPLEQRAAEADAARETAEEALAQFDAETRQQAEAMGWALRGAFESGYVTSAARNARESADARAERRRGLAAAASEARAEDRAAERALDAAATPRPDHELWAFAVILELLKGALAWFATASERRTGTVPGANSVLQCNTKLADDPRALSPSDRRALKTYCASTLATLRHMEACRA